MSDDRRSPMGDYFTAILTHDISNFNQTARGYLEMLAGEQMGPTTSQQQRALESCLRQSRRIQSLVESVRLLEELADSPAEPEDVDLDAAIREAVASVQREYSEREIRVEFTGAGRRVHAEPSVVAVFQHLVRNAVQHNDCEVVEIALSARLDDSSGRWVVEVSDNGPGVPEAKRDALFERLRARQIHGAGLGLSLVRELLERWSGVIRARGAGAGRGARFEVEIPAAP